MLKQETLLRQRKEVIQNQIIDFIKYNYGM
jgi:hypothetical protein